MLAGRAAAELGWPDRDVLFAPRSAGRRVLIDQVAERIGDPLARAGAEVKVGILPADLSAEKTEAPLALLCEFQRRPTDEQLDLAHRLAWNLCRSRLLITLERARIRAWSCCLPPNKNNRIVFDDATSRRDSETSVGETALHALHWISLTSGDFFQKREPAFRNEGRADVSLLRNLREVRAELLRTGLKKEVCHDLLARLIFVQFLFQRTDSNGVPFIDERLLKSRFKGQISEEYENVQQILRHREDTYAMFRWLNERFNGDLFPGKGETEAEREREWEEEQRHVTTDHLRLLADFVGGTLQIRKRQFSLWPMYSFDTIPLEFISSVYEQFVSEDAKKSKAYYTRPHLVDYMLDNVLPWDSDEWNLRVLDPCCGSGIFLVKAFQRIIHRWQNAHGGRDPSVPDLKPLLSRNFFGVDVDEEAVRVASFSLYLAMCDAIDPRHYWKHTVLPRLRDRSLIAADFFRDDIAGFRTEEDAGTFDLILGNAPWGKNTIAKDSPARKWSDKHGWPTTYNDIGPLFLAKSSRLAKRDAWVSMIQPASSLLFNRTNTAMRQREKLFSELRVVEVTNLSALRFVLFADAVKGPCILTYQNRRPAENNIVVYICPKASKTSDDAFRVVIEPNDINEISQRDLSRYPHIWTALAWGGWRDVQLIAELDGLPCLQVMKDSGAIKTGEGIIRGKTNKRRYEWLFGRRILESEEFPPGVFLQLDAATLPKNLDPLANRPRKPDLFELPQLIIKQSWIANPGRFRAAIVKSTPKVGGVICSDSYVSVSARPPVDRRSLETACLVLNSSFATYHQLLTSGRFATFIPMPLESELRRVPLPEPQSGLLDAVNNYEEIDERVFELFGFRPSERILIDDLFQFTLPDFKGDETSPGRRSTPRSRGDDPDLWSYSEQFMRVLRAGFGRDKQLRATIFQESDRQALPVRLLAIHLNWPARSRPIDVEVMESDDLLQQLTILYQQLMRPGPKTPGFVYERHARLYVEHPTADGTIPTVMLVKPDQRRHWTRSQAMRDADDVVAEILRVNWLEQTE